ncbi:MAG TPA: GTPase Era [Candidatus Dormibacteraeota bacterium]|nr:GTPase Era [Candidatus Dormibacteraeota bacterium]
MRKRQTGKRPARKAKVKNIRAAASSQADERPILEPDESQAVPIEPAQPSGTPLESRNGFKSGFVAVIGLPNAGKSTFVNWLVGRKVAIVSSKPQTTRNRIVGIVHRPGAQIVLVDTPGLHRPANALGRQMAEEIEKGIEGVDVVAVIVDAARPFGREDRFPIERARRFSGPSFLLLNKIDSIEKTRLLPLIDAFRREHDWAEVIPISALTGVGMGILVEQLIRRLPEGPPYFPADQFTDQPERFLAAELIREKALKLTEQEVPYSIGVAIDRFMESDRLIRIYATILVEREGQKGILIGKGGARMKKIGTQARLELEPLLGAKIYLELFVKVQPGWRDNPSVIGRLDWRQEFEEFDRG